MAAVQHQEDSSHGILLSQLATPPNSNSDQCDMQEDFNKTPLMGSAGYRDLETNREQ
jgi:hypothetical protein